MQWTLSSSLDYFALLVADDDHFPLTEAAAAVAQAEWPELDLQPVLDQVDALGAKLAARLPADAGALHRVKLLHGFFFEEQGFAGNVNNYYSSANSYLHEVLRTRRGIPISLAVLYIEWAQRIGLRASGVSFPGHFLVKLQLPLGDALIDPMSGNSLTREALEERLDPYLARHRDEAERLARRGEAALSAFLVSATPREVIARMLRNLEALHRGDEDWVRLLAVQERLVTLLPADWAWRRERGLTHAQLGQAGAAIEDLALYLRHAPAAPDRGAIAAQLEVLREAGPPRWH